MKGKDNPWFAMIAETLTCEEREFQQYIHVIVVAESAAEFTPEMKAELEKIVG